MRIFAWSRWASFLGFSRRPITSERASDALTKFRVREKHGDKRLAVLEFLEIRGLIGSFLADMAVTAQGVAAAERLRDPFAEPS